MRQWNFEQGTTSLQARVYRYGCQPEAAPLSPKSRLVHIALEEPVASPTTVLSRKPIYDDVEPQCTDNCSHDPDLGVLYPFDATRLLTYSDTDLLRETAGMFLDYGEAHPRESSTSAVSQCYSCGSNCRDTQNQTPFGESPHWFLDVHDGVKRKVAYVLCWKCVDIFVGQLQRQPHPGCGHLPFLSLPSCKAECQRMFCGRCRTDMGQR